MIIDAADNTDTDTDGGAKHLDDIECRPLSGPFATQQIFALRMRFEITESPFARRFRVGRRGSPLPRRPNQSVGFRAIKDTEIIAGRCVRCRTATHLPPRRGGGLPSGNGDCLIRLSPPLPRVARILRIEHVRWVDTSGECVENVVGHVDCHAATSFLGRCGAMWRQQDIRECAQRASRR